MTSSLLAGVGRADITPAPGAILQGYAPGRPSKSVHDPLHFTAFAFAQEETRAVVCTADLCLISEPLITEIRTAIADAAGVPRDNVVVCATHTHSGPVTRRLPGNYPLDEDYLYKTLVPRAAQAAADAAAALRPAVMGVGTVHSDVGVNRRQVMPDGHIDFGQNPWGCWDPTMTVVSFREPDGTPIGNMIHYGAHNTASGQNPEITRDWCGVMIDRLEAVSGGVTAFFNGCEGDCGPRLPNGKTTGDLQMMLELGGRAAMDAVRAWRGITDWRADCALRTVTGTITLPLKPLASLETLEAQLSALGDPAALSGLKHTEYRTLTERIALRRSSASTPDAFDIRQSAVAVGNTAFLPIPFEVFSEITLRLRDYSPFAHTLSLSNGNGSLYYFPSQDQICRGGYEVWMFSSMALRPFADDSDQRYIDGSVRLLQALYGQDT